MKSFLDKYSYSCIKMFVNQIAISIFGAVLAMATAASGNDVLTAVVSVCAVIFYLFLLYTMVWEIGSRDRVATDSGRSAFKPMTGLVISLFGNALNLLLAVIYLIGYFFMDTNTVAGSTCAVVRVIVFITEGMYQGLTSVLTVLGHPLWFYPYTYFLIVVPSLLVSTVAYLFGHANMKLSKLFDYEDPDKKKKQKEDRE